MMEVKDGGGDGTVMELDLGGGDGTRTVAVGVCVCLSGVADTFGLCGSAGAAQPRS